MIEITPVELDPKCSLLCNQCLHSGKSITRYPCSECIWEPSRPNFECDNRIHIPMKSVKQHTSSQTTLSLNQLNNFDLLLVIETKRKAHILCYAPADIIEIGDEVKANFDGNTYTGKVEYKCCMPFDGNEDTLTMILRLYAGLKGSTMSSIQLGTVSDIVTRKSVDYGGYFGEDHKKISATLENAMANFAESRR